MSHPFTCIKCNVFFEGKSANGAPLKDGEVDVTGGALFTAHYKSDWHQFNLKRSLAGLPTVTAENFQERVTLQQCQSTAAEEYKEATYRCDPCGKLYSTKNTFDSHLQSRKHKEMDARANAPMKRKVSALSLKSSAATGSLTSEKSDSVREKIVVPRKDRPARMDEDDEWETDEEVDADEDNEFDCDPLGPEECLFCPTVSKSLTKNIKHMSVAHSFFIPDVEYLVNLEGLMAHLGEKVAQLRMCLWCNHRSKVFPDTRSVQQHMTDKGHCKLNHEGDAMLEYANFYDYSASYPDFKDKAKGKEGDEAMEDDDDDTSLISGEVRVDNPYQLNLPSGLTVGHRALQRYYRQKLRPGRTLAICNETSSMSKVVEHYKNLGVLGKTGDAAKRRAKDIMYVNRMKSRYSMHLAVKANKLQHHFRDDNFGTH